MRPPRRRNVQFRLFWMRGQSELVENIREAIAACKASDVLKLLLGLLVEATGPDGAEIGRR